MNMDAIKKELNNLIKNDKKHIRIYDNNFKEFDDAKNNNVNLFFKINNETYKVLDHVVVSNDGIISNSSFFINVIFEINKLENNDLTSWIIDNIEYLRIRIYSIHENLKNVHLYKFKKDTPSNKDIILEV